MERQLVWTEGLPCHFIPVRSGCKLPVRRRSIIRAKMGRLSGGIVSPGKGRLWVELAPAIATTLTTGYGAALSSESLAAKVGNPPGEAIRGHSR
jgi:hypothetical protein